MDISNLVRPNIRALTPYTSARDTYNQANGIFLDANENPFGAHSRYPDPYQTTLKTSLADQKNVSVSELFIGNGSDEIIDLVFRVFCEPTKDKVLLFPPTYGMYEVIAAINNVEVITSPLAANFQINLDHCQPLLNDPSLKLIIICTPNNPTGNVIAPATIQEILSSFNGIVYLDEAYIDFVPEASWVPHLKKHPRLIISQTLSKAWGLAAARIGMAFASPQIITLLNAVKPPYNISTGNQELALAALNSPTIVNTNIQTIIRERRRLNRLLSHHPEVLHIYPSDANFLLIRVKQPDQWYRSLLKKGIIIRNRSNQIPGCIRVSIGTPKENDLFINAITTP